MNAPLSSFQLGRQASGAARVGRESPVVRGPSTLVPVASSGAHPRPKVAIIGSGIAGLGAAWGLRHEADVTVFEAGSYFGGHANTVDLRLDGISHGVDTGFLVYNERTYPQLIQLFAELGVTVAKSDMSFSVQAPGLEWSGSNLNSVFAQRSNLLRPGFWRMLQQILRFNRLCTELAERGADEALAEPLESFLARHRFGAEFRDGYLLPMIACIWSCPTGQMLSFPVGTLIRFCHNHGLIQVSERPQWFTVAGGSRHYVRRIIVELADARLNTPVKSVRRLPSDSGQAGVLVETAGGVQRFDEVLLACHTDQSLKLLADATPAERSVLGAIRYQPNRAVLHTDERLLPSRRLAWAAWNYERGATDDAGQTPVCLHYLLNKLQPLPWQRPVIVSLNPLREPDPAQVHAEFEYDHPVFDLAAVAAQKRLPEIQGRSHVWFAGAWTRYGFHEDGLMSGQAVAQALREQWAAVAGNWRVSA